MPKDTLQFFMHTPKSCWHPAGNTSSSSNCWRDMTNPQAVPSSAEDGVAPSPNATFTCFTTCCRPVELVRTNVNMHRQLWSQPGLRSNDQTLAIQALPLKPHQPLRQPLLSAGLVPCFRCKLAIHPDLPPPEFRRHAAQPVHRLQRIELYLPH